MNLPKLRYSIFVFLILTSASISITGCGGDESLSIDIELTQNEYSRLLDVSPINLSVQRNLFSSFCRFSGPLRQGHLIAVKGDTLFEEGHYWRCATEMVYHRCPDMEIKPNEQRNIAHVKVFGEKTKDLHKRIMKRCVKDAIKYSPQQPYVSSETINKRSWED